MTRDDLLRRDRDREIYRLYKAARDILPLASDIQLCAVVAAMPAPSFYMDAETCAKFVGVMLRGRTPGGLSRRRLDCYGSLLRRFRALRSAGRTGGRPLIEVSEELVGMPAPSFWLEPDTIRKIVARERAEERRRLYEKVK